jgi:hypothetical protein
MPVLLLVAEHDGPAMFARIGIRKALNRQGTQARGEVSSARPRAANNPAQLGRDRLDWETQDSSAALSRDIAGGDLVLVGGKGCQNFGLLAPRDLGEVQGPPEFGCDLIEF